ncbi:MAG: bifunctional phosphopantothenoylcysteine decarboxylase/phosphopantothenate--cysteine ligase CoaBC [Desulfobacterales bacterium]|jgi:phosphopantothenoylcysteine decarboxylase/phosphopantothenate--cysteine ligase|nr:bifunctional phosphopantothenoylcysteine decarboxylase/phosphopantothenate--cysteine ligase CoaBC [Desulfobacterales bacterium]
METEIPILKGRSVVVGVSGGIAAYKAADLTSRLVKAGAQVDVVMTPAAAEFVRPLTFQALTHRPVALEMFALWQETEIGHVSLGKRADLMIIAPATANTLAKLAHGMADTLLATTALACRGPILLAPAMESGMWANPATADNMKVLERRGYFSVGPESGRLASGADGLGRMSEPETILDAARWVLGRRGPLAGEKVVVTAGGTREAIDPVRFVGNHSSGKMGFALAAAARDRGAEVTLVHGPSAQRAPYGLRAVAVESAEQMQAAVWEAAGDAAAIIMAAAVADYRPKSAAEHKIKKTRGELALELVRTPDILAAVAQRRRQSGAPRAVIGFAAETDNVLENAREKLARKGLDLIVANDVLAADSGFAVDTNRVTLIDGGGVVEALPLMSKTAVAEAVIDRLAALLRRV